MFDKLRAKFGASAAGPAAPAAKLDPAMGDAAAEKMRADLAVGRWPAALKVIEDCRDANQRDFYITVAAEWDGKPPWIAAWAAARPKIASSHLVQGVHLIRWAWEARTGARASGAPEERTATFAQRLDMAKQALEHAATLYEQDPTPWAHLVRVAIGRGDAEAATEYFTQAVERWPDHHLAHRSRLVSLAAKSGGSHEAMFEFARHTADEAPRGSALHVIIALAHIERWLYFISEGTATAKQEREAYFRDAAVKKEIIGAHAKSLGSSNYLGSPFAMEDRNRFAFAFYLIGMRDLAKAEFEAIGPNATAQPWGYLGDPLTAFAKARAGAMAPKTPT